MTTRAALHDLVDGLPDDLLDDAQVSLARLAAERERREAIWKRLEEAPYDDEPLSPREIEALRRYDAGERSGRVYTEQEILDLIEAAANRG